MKILIKVTKDVLRQSMHCSLDQATSNCAISVAVRHLLPDAKVLPNFITTPDACMLLPREAQLFIYAFDNATPEQRLALPEISFEIDLPNEVIEMIGIGEVYKVLSESITLELVMP